MNLQQKPLEVQVASIIHPPNVLLYRNAIKRLCCLRIDNSYNMNHHVIEGSQCKISFFNINAESCIPSNVFLF